MNRNASDRGLLEQWEGALAIWVKTLEILRDRFETLNRDFPNLYAIQRSWPTDEVKPLHEYLKFGRRFSTIPLPEYCPDNIALNWLLPIHARGLPLDGMYVYQRGDRHEIIFLYGELAGWQIYHQLACELTQMITRTVRGYQWPFGKSKPQQIDMSTWPRESISACVNGHMPHRINRLNEDNDDSSDKVGGFFQTKGFQLVSISAKAVTPLLFAASKTTYPGPSTHRWPTAIVNDNDHHGLDSRLIWQPNLHWMETLNDNTENDSPVWYLYPFRSRRFTFGSFSAAALSMAPASIPIPSYEPTEKEVAFISSIYPDQVQKQPPWELIRGELLVMGIASDGLPDLTSKAIVHLLQKKYQPNTESVSETNNCEILFLSANPTDTDQLRLDSEVRSIESKLRASEYRDRLVLSTKWAVTADDLLQVLNEHSPQILHFSGHGTSASEIILSGADGCSWPVSGAALQSLLKTLKGLIRLVVLNSCFSHQQAKAIISHVDCAIGMSDSIGDDAARAFAASLYRAIGFGKSIREAFDQGVTSLLLEGSDEGDTPKLLCRDGVNANEVYLLSKSDA